MILLDVNVLVYAHRADMPEHTVMADFLDKLRKGTQPFGVPEIALSALVRIVTQSSLKPPSSTTEAFAFCDALIATPHCMVVRSSEKHWTIFEELCRASRARGKLVADAYLAAYAVDRDDEWVTTDRDFARFPGLRWRHPTEPHARTNPR